MILTIAKKEFLENVLSRKFLVAFVLAVLILGTGVFAMSRAYEEKKDYYDTQLVELEQGLEEGTSGYQDIAETEMFRELEEPESLSTLISGEETVQTGMGETSRMIAQAGAEETTSPLWDRFGMLDLTFIVGFLMSLMAVIFSYDSISGEKEKGTLKLTLTNDVPKDHVLLGKYIGGTASVLLPFILALLLGLGIVALVVGVPFSSADYQAIGLLVIIGCATISAFYLLGMLVSSLTKRSAVSMIVALFIWIFLVQGIGNVASLVATETTGAMTYEEYRNQYMSITQEVMEEYRLENQLGNMQQAFEEIQQRWEALEEEFTRQQEAQLKTALAVAMISPAESYRNVGQALAGLSWDEGQQTQEQTSDYLAALEREYEEWMEQQREESEENIPFGPGGGTFQPGRDNFVIQPGGGTSENFESETRLDYYYESWGVGERIGSATYDIVSIVMFNILMFIGAYVVFLRYDVR